MVLKVYSVYDSKACAYLQPFFCVNRAVALRSFMTAVQDRGSDFSRFSGDYTLFEIGEWNQIDGLFKVRDSFENLGVATQYLNSEVSS